MNDRANLSKMRMKCRNKFLKIFPKGFYDPKYLDWERDYKWRAHEMFQLLLNRRAFERLLSEGDYQTIAKNAITVETKTNLLFSFEKMALRDSVKSLKHAKVFSLGLFNFLYSKSNVKERFEHFSKALSSLPEKRRRVLTWPVQTVFAFLANPEHFIFLKPRVTQAAAKAYGFDFFYEPKPNWNTYNSVYAFANQIKQDNEDLKPRDYIDLQSFIWVMGSDEYR